MTPQLREPRDVLGPQVLRVLDPEAAVPRAVLLRDALVDVEDPRWRGRRWRGPRPGGRPRRRRRCAPRSCASGMASDGVDARCCRVVRVRLEERAVADPSDAVHVALHAADPKPLVVLHCRAPVAGFFPIPKGMAGSSRAPSAAALRSSSQTSRSRRLAGQILNGRHADFRRCGAGPRRGLAKLRLRPGRADRSRQIHRRVLRTPVGSPAASSQ